MTLQLLTFSTNVGIVSFFFEKGSASAVQNAKDVLMLLPRLPEIAALAAFSVVDFSVSVAALIHVSPL